jgi:hypothetical protein
MTQETKKKLGARINEHVLSTFILLGSVGLTAYAFTIENQKLQILSLLLVRAGLFLTIGSLFITFLNGIGFNVKTEIFKEHNTAAAILVAGFWIGLAVVLSVTM